MSPDNFIDEDGYEENPWDDAGESVPIKDFLPPPEAFKNAIVQMKPNGMTMFALSPEDLTAMEHMAAESGTNLAGLVASILHDYASGQLVKRGD